MAGARPSMHKTREILRQKWVQGRSHREVAASQGVSVGMVAATLDRARAAGLSDWSAVETLSETDLELRLYGPPRQTPGAPGGREALRRLRGAEAQDR